jgi:hypothetical protein
MVVVARKNIMQISRHWRVKSLRYRLEGVRYENGEISLQNRPAPAATDARKSDAKATETSEHMVVAAVAAR